MSSLLFVNGRVLTALSSIESWLCLLLSCLLLWSQRWTNQVYQLGYESYAFLHGDVYLQIPRYFIEPAQDRNFTKQLDELVLGLRLLLHDLQSDLLASPSTHAFCDAPIATFTDERLYFVLAFDRLSHRKVHAKLVTLFQVNVFIKLLLL